MSNKLNESCNDAIEKFTVMTNQGKKINEPQMRDWANQMLNGQGEYKFEKSVSADSHSIFSDNYEFKFDNFKRDQSNSSSEKMSRVMSTIENFEKLQNTSINQGFDEPMQSKAPRINFEDMSDYKCKTEQRRYETYDLMNQDDDPQFFKGEQELMDEGNTPTTSGGFAGV